MFSSKREQLGHRKERWDRSKSKAQRTNIKSCRPAPGVHCSMVCAPKGLAVLPGLLLSYSPLWLCFPQQIVHIPGISISLASLLHLCLHCSHFLCHCLWGYLKESSPWHTLPGILGLPLKTRWTPPWLHNSWVLHINQVTTTQTWQDLASAQAIIGFTWIIALVTSEYLDSWT